MPDEADLDMFCGDLGRRTSFDRIGQAKVACRRLLPRRLSEADQPRRAHRIDAEGKAYEGDEGRHHAPPRRRTKNQRARHAMPPPGMTSSHSDPVCAEQFSFLLMLAARRPWPRVPASRPFGPAISSFQGIRLLSGSAHVGKLHVQARCPGCRPTHRVPSPQAQGSAVFSVAYKGTRLTCAN